MTVIVTSCKWWNGWPPSPHVSKRWSLVMLLCSRLQPGPLLPTHTSLWKTLCSTGSVLCQLMQNQCHTLSLCSSVPIPFGTSSQHRDRRRNKDPDCHYQQQATSLHVGSYCGVEWESPSTLQTPRLTGVTKHTLKHSQESYVTNWEQWPKLDGLYKGPAFVFCLY